MLMRRLAEQGWRLMIRRLARRSRDRSAGRADLARAAWLRWVAATGAAAAVACSSTPAFSGWTAEQLYAHGEQAFAEQDWGEARDSFEHLLLTFPGFGQVVEARSYLAQAFFEDEQYVSAISEFTRIVQAYPDHESAGDAWMGLCRSYAAMSPHPQRDQQYTRQARTTCENVASDFRGTAVADSAMAVAGRMFDKLAARVYGEAQFYFQRDIYESAELGFLRLLELFPNTTSAPLALVRLIEIYDQWGWDEEREQYETQLLEDYPDSPEAREFARARPDSTAVREGVDSPSGEARPTAREPSHAPKWGSRCA